MIVFEISFLLSFLNNPQNETSKKSKGGKDSKGENEKTLKKETSKKPREEASNKSKSPKLDSKIATNAIDAGRFLGSAHMDIMMLPNTSVQSIDVICHEYVAKIFTHPDSKAVKVLVLDNIVWVPVHLRLKYESFKDPEDLISVAHKFVAHCNVSVSSGKLSNAAKMNKVKIYYHGVNCNNSNFVEVFEKDPTISKSNAVKREKLVHSNYNKVHLCYLDKIIYRPEGVWYNQFIPFPSPPLTPEDELLSDEEFEEMLEKYKNLEYRPYSKKQVSKKGAGSKKTTSMKVAKTEKEQKLKTSNNQSSKTKTKTNLKSKTNDDANSKNHKSKQIKTEYPFNISGESYFTNPNITIYKIAPIGSTLKNVFMMVSVIHLMTAYQKTCLKPLVINIRKIMNLPYDFLLNNRFISIFLRYSTAQFQYSCSTLPRNIKDHMGNTDMRIDEAHVSFIRDLNIYKVEEFFQTRQLKIEIVGVRDIELLKTNSPSLYGNELQDKNISNISTLKDYLNFLKYTKEPVEEVIAVCSVDLTFTAHVLHETTTAYCHHPENRLVQSYESAYRTSPFNFVANKTEINLNYKMLKSNKTNPVTEALLLSSDTCVKVDWFLYEQLELLGPILACNEMYRRAIFVIKERELAATILRQIMMHNQEILTSAVILPNYFRTLTRDCLKPSGIDYLSPYIKTEVITGFVVDNFETFLFFLETRSSFLMALFEDTSRYTEIVCHILFDSNLVFEKRLYNEFLNYGGYYILTMQQALQEILRDQKVYMKGNLPIPCYEALMKLDLIMKSYNISSIYKKNLLPTSKELMSLQMEFGATHRWIDTSDDY